MEWQCTIKVGAARFHFNFKDGGLVGNGVAPATLTTSNKVYQSVIENSELFKKGAIRLLHTYGDDETIPKTTDKVNVAKAEQVEEKNAENDGTLRTYSVSSVAEAKDILIAEGVGSSKLRNKAAILEVAKQKNIEFKWVEN